MTRRSCGIGANTALRDADLLRRQLTSVHKGQLDLIPAMHEYERQMLDYGFAAVKSSLRNAKMAGSANRIVRGTFRGTLRVAGAVPANQAQNVRRHWAMMTTNRGAVRGVPARPDCRSDRAPARRSGGSPGRLVASLRTPTMLASFTIRPGVHGAVSPIKRSATMPLTAAWNSQYRWRDSIPMLDHSRGGLTRACE
jgi:hypothetical protein